MSCARHPDFEHCARRRAFGCVTLFAPPALGALRRGLAGAARPDAAACRSITRSVSVAAWMALYEYFNRRFAWNKTEHGLARRRAPVEAVRSGVAILAAACAGGCSILKAPTKLPSWPSIDRAERCGPVVVVRRRLSGTLLRN